MYKAKCSVNKEAFCLFFIYSTNLHLFFFVVVFLINYLIYSFVSCYLEKN